MPEPLPETTSRPKPPPPPADLGPRGLVLWASIADTFGMPQHERDLLHEACRVADRLDALDAVVRAEGVTVTGPQGVKAHPALTEARQQGITLTRLVASLRVPDDDDQRPQRRGSARGTYGTRQYGSKSTGRR